jgi:uncharacterized protein YebE (UPF0316 family)
MSADYLLLLLAVFSLRVINNGLGTVRVIAITYGRRRLAFGLAFIESLIFAITVSQVVSNLSSIPMLIAYCGGFATGGYLGMWIEDRYVTGYMTVNIISRVHGPLIAAALRGAGFGVTVTQGEGAEGAVTVLRCVVLRRQVSAVKQVVLNVSPKAFMTVEEARAIHQGWVNARVIKQR